MYSYYLKFISSIASYYYHFSHTIGNNKKIRGNEKIPPSWGKCQGIHLGLKTWNIWEIENDPEIKSSFNKEKTIK